MTEPRYNLFRHGYEGCAQLVIGRLRAFRKMVYVYIAPNGDVHCRTNRCITTAPNRALVGCYTRNAQPHMVEDDFLAWLREQSAQAEHQEARWTA